jgi:predicted phosphohydrolase
MRKWEGGRRKVRVEVRRQRTESEKLRRREAGKLRRSEFKKVRQGNDFIHLSISKSIFP